VVCVSASKLGCANITHPPTATNESTTVHPTSCRVSSIEYETAAMGKHPAIIHHHHVSSVLVLDMRSDNGKAVALHQMATTSWRRRFMVSRATGHESEIDTTQPHTTQAVLSCKVYYSLFNMLGFWGCARRTRKEPVVKHSLNQTSTARFTCPSWQFGTSTRTPSGFACRHRRIG
jgi:hypothetical protein